MLVLAIVAFVLAAAALVASIIRGATLRAGAIWWVSAIVAVGLMAFGGLSLLVGPGPLIALVFGVVLWLLGAVGVALLYRGLPRARRG